MIVNRALILDALVGQRVLFTRGLQNPPMPFDAYALRVDSSGPSEQYNFTGGVPGMRAWLGERVINSLEGKRVILVNNDYELTVGIPRNDYEDDKLGLWSGDVQMMGRRAAMHPIELFVDMLNYGFVTTGTGGAAYDGAPFFSTAHPRSGRGLANQSNKGTAALDAAAFQAGITALRGLTDDQGKALNLIGEGVELHLMVPPALESTGKALVEAERLASGASNTDYNRAKLKVLNGLTSDTAWFLAIVGLPVKPMLHQVRREPVLAVKDLPTDENVFMDREVIVGCDGRYAVGYAMWQLMYGSTGAA